MSNHDLDRLTLDDALDLTPREPDPEADDQLTLLDDLASTHLDSVDQLIYLQLIKRGLPASQVAPATGLSTYRVGERAREIIERLRVLVHAPPLPEPEPTPETLTVLDWLCRPAPPDRDEEAARLFADWIPLREIANRLGLPARWAAHRAVNRGLSKAPAEVVERVAYRRANPLRRRADARTELVTAGGT